VRGAVVGVVVGAVVEDGAVRGGELLALVLVAPAPRELHPPATTTSTRLGSRRPRRTVQHLITPCRSEAVATQVTAREVTLRSAPVA
jgi:hypothetical protein